MSTQNELQEMLEATKEQFNRSQIKLDAEKAGKKWMYVAATRIIPNNPLILGFNWGARKEEQYISCRIPTIRFRM